MKLTKEAKQIVSALIDQSIDEGFGTYYPLRPIAEKLKIPDLLYDKNTESGILWELGSFGRGPLAGFVFFNREGTHAAISYEEHTFLANCCHVD